MLPGDGITTPDLTVKGAQRVFGAVLVDVRVARKSVPAMGEAASAAKNLDEYQFMIYSLVPSIPDFNLSKMQPQKYRVAIVALFAKLMPLLQEVRQDGLLLALLYRVAGIQDPFKRAEL